MTKILYIGFDMDGTIIDSMKTVGNPIFGRLMNEYFSQISVKEAIAHNIATAGMPIEQEIILLVEKFGTSITEDKILEIKEKFEREKKEKIITASLFPDIPHALSKLKSLNYQLFISSSTPQETLDVLINNKRLDRWIDYWFGVKAKDPDFKKGKAHFMEAAKRFEVPYGELVKRGVFVGDGEYDMEIAVENGMIGIGRVYLIPAAKLKKAGAKVVLRDLANLPKIISKF